MQMGENYEILKTNLQPFFWKKVKNKILLNRIKNILFWTFYLDTITGEGKISNFHLFWMHVK